MVGDLSPKPTDREHHRDRESHQFKSEVKRAQLARLDVLNEFSDESHGVKKYGLRYVYGHCQIRVTDGTARRHSTQILGVFLLSVLSSALLRGCGAHGSKERSQPISIPTKRDSYKPYQLIA